MAVAKKSVNINNIRNFSIIAHIDHGKSTLADRFIQMCGGLQDREMQAQVLDSMELERERGITIAAKNCAVAWKGVKINILDTPGHADFGGEVERALSMVDGAILLVDAAEGPLPQTRFVLRKALENRLAIVVVINKIDRKDARPEEVLNLLVNLFIDLGADEAQLDFPVIYAVGREGRAQRKLETREENLACLFDTILEKIPGPRFDKSAPFQMRVANLGFSEYVGRLAVGKVTNGSVKKNDSLVCINKNNLPQPLKVLKLQVYSGMGFLESDEVVAGDVAILAGIDEVEIGDTICTKDAPKALPRIHIEEPTISMRFTANNSPLAGREGKFVHPQKIGERLRREAMNNIALRVEGGAGDESFIVKGRGELQMAIVIETLRREGFELSVGRPQIIYKYEGEKKLEPIEHLWVDCDESSFGIITEKLSKRRGKMVNMQNHGSGRVQLEFTIPSRGLIGYRSEFLTDTRGTGVMNSYLEGYEEYRGDIVSRVSGSLVSDRDGEAVSYAIFHLEPRGRVFVRPGDVVYEGMIVGEHNRDNDLDVNPCKAKKLTNIRAAGRDENIVLTPVTPLSLEQAIEFIRDDELVEITPSSIRLRKQVLKANLRK